MALSTAIPAYGTLIKKGDGATPEVFSTIIQAGNFSGPGQTNDKKEVTSHTSPSRTKEWLVTLRDNKAFRVPLFWDPTNPVHQALKADSDSGARGNYQVVLPLSKGVFSVAMFITDFEPVENVADPLMLNVEFQPTGTNSFA